MKRQNETNILGPNKKRKKNPAIAWQVYMRTDNRSSIGRLPDVKRTAHSHLNYDKIVGYENSGFLNTFQNIDDKKANKGYSSGSIMHANTCAGAIYEYSLGKKYIHTVFIPENAVQTTELEQISSNGIDIVKPTPGAHGNGREFHVYKTNRLNQRRNFNQKTMTKIDKAETGGNLCLLKGDYPIGTHVFTESVKDIKAERKRAELNMRGGTHYNLNVRIYEKMKDQISDNDKKNIFDLLRSAYSQTRGAKDLENLPSEIKENIPEQILDEMLNHQDKSSWRINYRQWQSRCAKSKFPQLWRECEKQFEVKNVFNHLYDFTKSHKQIYDDKELWNTGYEFKDNIKLKHGVS